MVLLLFVMLCSRNGVKLCVVWIVFSVLVCWFVNVGGIVCLLFVDRLFIGLVIGVLV